VSGLVSLNGVSQHWHFLAYIGFRTVQAPQDFSSPPLGIATGLFRNVSGFVSLNVLPQFWHFLAYIGFRNVQVPQGFSSPSLAKLTGF
jgi:hypothetical protein